MRAVTKSEFARITGVSPSTVSGWLADRHIDGQAILGEGRGALIVVEVAVEQLRRRRDIGQALGNGLDTRLRAPSPPAVAPDVPAANHAEPSAPLLALAATSWAPPVGEMPPVSEVADAVEDRIKREKLTALERENRRLAEEEAERVGRYIDKASAQRQMGKIAKAMLDVFEGGLPQFATAVSERWGMPQRDVLHLLNDVNRTVRARAAEALRRQADDLPRLIEDESEADTAG